MPGGKKRRDENKSSDRPSHDCIFEDLKQSVRARELFELLNTQFTEMKDRIKSLEKENEGLVEEQETAKAMRFRVIDLERDNERLKKIVETIEKAEEVGELHDRVTELEDKNESYLEHLTYFVEREAVSDACVEYLQNRMCAEGQFDLDHNLFISPEGEQSFVSDCFGTNMTKLEFCRIFRHGDLEKDVKDLKLSREEVLQVLDIEPDFTFTTGQRMIAGRWEFLGKPDLKTSARVYPNSATVSYTIDTGMVDLSVECVTWRKGFPKPGKYNDVRLFVYDYFNFAMPGGASNIAKRDLSDSDSGQNVKRRKYGDLTLPDLSESDFTVVDACDHMKNKFIEMQEKNRHMQLKVESLEQDVENLEDEKKDLEIENRFWFRAADSFLRSKYCSDDRLAYIRGELRRQFLSKLKVYTFPIKKIFSVEIRISFRMSIAELLTICGEEFDIGAVTHRNAVDEVNLALTKDDSHEASRDQTYEILGIQKHQPFHITSVFSNSLYVTGCIWKCDRDVTGMLLHQNFHVRYKNNWQVSTCLYHNYGIFLERSLFVAMPGTTKSGSKRPADGSEELDSKRQKPSGCFDKLKQSIVEDVCAYMKQEFATVHAKVDSLERKVDELLKGSNSMVQPTNLVEEEDMYRKEFSHQD
eukprot:gene69-542_t